MLVHVVGHDPDLLVAQQHLGDAAQLGLGIGAPVGFDGEFRISHLVCGVIAASRSSGRNLKPLFCGHGTGTGVPSDSSTISG